MKETVNKDLILRERLALQENYISKSDYSFSFFSYCNVFFVAGLSTRNLLKIENNIVIEYRFILLHSLF
jgi:putative membrane protein